MNLLQLAEREPWERLSALEAEIVALCPPIDPPACHWLNSDAGPSYCLDHAWAARWAQLPTIGEAPPIPDWWKRTKLDHLMWDGIDGCANMGGESDSPERCETCGCTLEYLLTDYGREEELAHFADYPVAIGDTINGELIYVLGRVFMNLDQPSAPENQTLAAIKIAEDTLAALRATSETSSVEGEA